MKLTARIKTPTKLTAKFKELKMPLSGVFEEGYERGYDEGYEVGNTEGYTKGHAEGLAARTYEVWTITLADGTIVEKEVALL